MKHIVAAIALLLLSMPISHASNDKECSSALSRGEMLYSLRTYKQDYISLLHRVIPWLPLDELQQLHVAWCWAVSNRDYLKRTPEPLELIEFFLTSKSRKRRIFRSWFRLRQRDY